VVTRTGTLRKIPGLEGQKTNESAINADGGMTIGNKKSYSALKGVERRVGKTRERGARELHFHYFRGQLSGKKKNVGIVGKTQVWGSWFREEFERWEDLSTGGVTERN